MTPLLQALKAASETGFRAPPCGRCLFSGGDCPDCHNTGLYASDSHGLIGRAERFLIGNDWTVIQGVDFVSICPLLWFEYTSDDQFKGRHEMQERHDGTAEGAATAMLRIIARTGSDE